MTVPEFFDYLEAHEQSRELGQQLEHALLLAHRRAAVRAEMAVAAAS